MSKYFISMTWEMLEIYFYFGKNEKKMITTVNGTDDNKEILNLFEEKCIGNNRDMQQTNNALISGIETFINILKIRIHTSDK